MSEYLDILELSHQYAKRKEKEAEQLQEDLNEHLFEIRKVLLELEKPCKNALSDYFIKHGKFPSTHQTLFDCTKQIGPMKTSLNEVNLYKFGIDELVKTIQPLHSTSSTLIHFNDLNNNGVKNNGVRIYTSLKRQLFYSLTFTGKRQIYYDVSIGLEYFGLKQ